MAWTFVGRSTLVTATTSPVSLTLPAGIQQGDLLVACIAYRSSATTSITRPSEWALAIDRPLNDVTTTTSSTSSGMIAYCVRGASDPGLSFTFPATLNIALAYVVAYRGGGAQHWVMGVGNSASAAANTTALSNAGQTTTTTNTLLVALFSGGSAGTVTNFKTTTPGTAAAASDSTADPSSTAWTQRGGQVTTTGADTALYIYDAVKTTAGATGNMTGTISLGARPSTLLASFRIAVVETPQSWSAGDKSAAVTLSSSDRLATVPSTGGIRSTGWQTNGTAGKYYGEWQVSGTNPGAGRVGITPVLSQSVITNTGNMHVNGNGGTNPIMVNNVNVGSVGGTTFAANDVICMAWDAGAELIWFRLNGGNWNNSATANPATGTEGKDASFAAAESFAMWANWTALANIQIRTQTAHFSQSVPSGFSAWVGAVSTSVNVTSPGPLTASIGEASGIAGLCFLKPIPGPSTTLSGRGTGTLTLTGPGDSNIWRAIWRIYGLTVGHTYLMEQTCSGPGFWQVSTIPWGSEGDIAFTGTATDTNPAYNDFNFVCPPGTDVYAGVYINVVDPRTCLEYPLITDLDASGGVDVDVTGFELTATCGDETVTTGAVNVNADVTAMPGMAISQGDESVTTTSSVSVTLTTPTTLTAFVGDESITANVSVSATITAVPQLTITMGDEGTSGKATVNAANPLDVIESYYGFVSVSGKANADITLAPALAITCGTATVATAGAVSVTITSVPGLTAFVGDEAASGKATADITAVPAMTMTLGDESVSIRSSTTISGVPALTITQGDETVAAGGTVSVTVTTLPALTITGGDEATSGKASVTIASVPQLTMTLGDETSVAKQNIVVTISGMTGLTASTSNVSIALGGLPATLNPADKKNANVILSNGNLTVTGTDSGGNNWVRSTTSKTGKRYVEFTITTVGNTIVGIADASGITTYPGNDDKSWGLFSNGAGSINGTFPAWGPTYASGNILCMAVDLTAKKVWYRVGTGDWNAGPSGNPVTGTGAWSVAAYTGTPHYIVVSGNNGTVTTVNFGASAFAHTPPAGFVSWDSNPVDAIAFVTGIGLTISTKTPVVNHAVKVFIDVLTPTIVMSQGTAYSSVSTRCNINGTSAAFQLSLKGTAAPITMGSAYVNSWGNHTNLVLTPQGEAGDLMLMMAFIRSTGVPPVITPPVGGWIEVFPPSLVSNGVSGGRFYVWWKQQGANEPNQTFTHTSADSIGWLKTIRNVDGIFPIDVQSPLSTGMYDVSTALSISTSRHNAEMLVMLAHDWNSASSVRNPPAGWTETYDAIIYASHKLTTVMGATGDAVMNNANGGVSGNEPWQAMMLGLVPSGVRVIAIKGAVLGVTMPQLTMSMGNVTVSVIAHAVATVATNPLYSFVGTPSFITHTAVNVTGNEMSIATSIPGAIIGYAYAYVSGFELRTYQGITFAPVPVPVPVTGIELDIIGGSVGVSIKATANASGNFMLASTQTPTVNPGTAAQPSATVPAMTITAGNVTVTGKANVAVTSDQIKARGLLGVLVEGAANAVLTGTGTSMAMTVGNVTVTQAANVNVTGLEMTVSTANPGAISISFGIRVIVTGLQMNCRIGSQVYVPQPSSPIQREGIMKTMANMMGN